MNLLLFVVHQEMAACLFYLSFVQGNQTVYMFISDI